MKFEPSPETFTVEEIAAYEPSGEGPHTFLLIEKRDLTTPEAVRRLARALGASEREAGYAGLKDRHATTRQWVSLPGVDPDATLAARVDGVRVLEARRHGHKLRTGHLRGNRFEVILTGIASGDAERVAIRLAELSSGGLPNRYGEQRFGAAGDNAARGLALLRGTAREHDRRLRRLMLSALQSAAFNRTLDLRAGAGSLRRVLGGDVLETARGGHFASTDAAADQARVDAGEIAITGPMPGSRAIEPPPGSAVRAIEDEALAALGATRDDFARAGRELPGARRRLLAAVDVPDDAVTPDPRGLRVRFGLPSGSYATVLVEALLTA